MFSYDVFHVECIPPSKASVEYGMRDDRAFVGSGWQVEPPRLYAVVPARMHKRHIARGSGKNIQSSEMPESIGDASS
jgi:hypothetical protein